MPLFTLAVFSAVAGVLILWVFKACSNQRALKATRRRLRAHLLAIRLFGDDPVVILRSQGKLLAWNARYLALLLPPFLVVAIPLFFGWDHLDAVWGRAPLATGDTVVVTARLRGEVPRVRLDAPAWLAVESPPVRIPAAHEVSWRVRVREAASGVLNVCAGAECSAKWVESRPGLRYLRNRAPSASKTIEWVEVPYPQERLDLLGVSLNWVVWFCLISTLTALMFRRKLRVTL